MGKSVNINLTGGFDADMQEPAETSQTGHGMAPANKEYNWTARVTFVSPSKTRWRGIQDMG